MAAAVRGSDVDSVVFHSGKEASTSVTCSPRRVRPSGVTQSMGRIGSALDNAAAASFNSTLEHELLSRRRFATTDQDRRAYL